MAAHEVAAISLATIDAPTGLSDRRGFDKLAQPPHAIACLVDSSFAEATFTWPLSSTPIFTPVRSMMLRIILPPGPMTSRTLSTGICHL